MASSGSVAAVRAFNRFHTMIVGALDEHILQSGYTLSQARILYEIGSAAPDGAPTARDLAARLRLDAGYLSRLLAGLESGGLIERRPSPDNAKRLLLTLSRSGRTAFGSLDSTSAEEISRLLAPLSPSEQRDLVEAMRCVRDLLGDTTAGGAFVLRDPLPGDLGLVCQRQARLYTDEHGWDWTFEGLVAEILGRFVAEFDPATERCWIAERDGRIAGSVFVVRGGEANAKLRLLYVEPWARGNGLGRRLVDEAVAFARARGYGRMVLWTQDCLVAAQHVYKSAGFELVEEEPHRSFGKEMVGQTWALRLTS